ncbi:MAG: LamG domain-containing protein, partial [Phaeodactylibacter sp.]|nr:LamG domain-containing protein [Phaeodactylibacter sp.]
MAATKKQLFSFFILSFILTHGLSAQDTTIVQTLTWQSDNRSGFYLFPEEPGAQYEKILMRYNMRCHDNAVGSGNVGCREWDYSCNTFITDPSMVDSTRATHPDYVIPGYPGDTFPYTGQPTYTYRQYGQYDILYGAVAGENEQEVLPSDFGIPITLGNPTGKMFFLYTAEELQLIASQGNPLTKLGFHVLEAGDGVAFLRFRLKPTSLTALSVENPPAEEGFTEVYFRNTTFNPGFNLIPIRPFVWDGASNLLLELSYTNSAGGQPVVLANNQASFSSQVAASGADRFLEFNGYGAVMPPAAVFENINQEITISFWCYGDPDNLPVNSSILEGNDANKQRQINVHLPWSNSRVYWDCGNDGGGYDRIEKDANPEDFAGHWNHWAFTKNAATGEMKMYLNGQLWHSGTGKVKPIDIQDFTIGSAVLSGNNYYGAIDEFRIWKKALSEQDIQSWMFRSLSPAHPEWGELAGYYPFDEALGTIAIDASSNGQDAPLFGAPPRRSHRGAALFKGFYSSFERPALTFIAGSYAEDPIEVTSTVVDSTQNAPYAIIRYGIDGNNALVALDTQFSWWATAQLLLDEQGNLLDTYPVAAEGSITPGMLAYYQKQDAKFELLSLVTPYGNGLSLGAQGKTFWFDVTDYASVLRGEKFLSVELGGQYQEELDIRFYFIKGTPPRDVLGIQNIWPFRRGWFDQIQDDRFFEPRQLPLRA